MIKGDMLNTDSPQIISLGYHGTGARVVRVHHIPAVGESVRAWDFQIIKDGGKGSHQAMVIGKYGGSVGFIGKMGIDEQSDEAITWLIEHNVDIRNLLRVEYKGRGSGLILVDDNGDNAIISVDDIRKTLTFEEVQPLIKNYEQAQVFITGFEIPEETALSSAKFAKSLGQITILNPSPAPIQPMENLCFIDFLVPNETEAKVLLGIESDEYVEPMTLAKSLVEKFNVGNVILTLGSRGALFFNRDESFIVDPFKIEAVDPIGAGDTFLGSFVFAYWVEHLTIFESLVWANAAAAISVSRKGSIPSFPTRDEVNKYILSNK
jgi:ribokinase